MKVMMQNRGFVAGVSAAASLAVLAAVAMPASLRADEAVPAEPALRWWKGNLHTHSLWSDGNDFPEMICEWYRTRDYHFLAISDHNVLSEGIRWMRHDEIERRGGPEAMQKYRDRFGGSWVETRGEPGTESFEVRLKPLDEYRTLVEERGKFLLIQSEEISDRAEGKPVHINAANITTLIEPQGGATVREAITNNLRAILEQERETGREILPHLNHPNFGWAVTAEDIATVVTEKFFEVYNGHPGVNHLGDETRPSVERIWDIANAIRLVQLDAEPLYGLGTDDTHHYHGRGGSRPGRGWVMVRAEYLTPEHLIRAMKRGDFYASSGVTLEDVQFDAETGTLSLQIAADEGATYTTEFIATLPPDPEDAGAESVAAEASSRQQAETGGEASQLPPLPSVDRIGKVMATSTDLNPQYTLRGDELYVRALVTSSLPAVDPSFPDQPQQAWTQPVGWSVGEDAAGEDRLNSFGR